MWIHAHIFSRKLYRGLVIFKLRKQAMYGTVVVGKTFFFLYCDPGSGLGPSSQANDTEQETGATRWLIVYVQPI